MTSRPRSSSSRWWFYFNLTDGNESGDYSRWYDVCIDICRRSPVLISTPQLLLMHPWPVTPGSRWVILTFRIDGDLDYYDRFDALQITLIFRPLQPLLPLPQHQWRWGPGGLLFSLLELMVIWIMKIGLMLYKLHWFSGRFVSWWNWGEG